MWLGGAAAPLAARLEALLHADGHDARSLGLSLRPLRATDGPHVAIVELPLSANRMVSTLAFRYVVDVLGARVPRLAIRASTRRAVELAQVRSGAPDRSIAPLATGLTVLPALPLHRLRTRPGIGVLALNSDALVHVGPRELVVLDALPPSPPGARAAAASASAGLLAARPGFDPDHCVGDRLVVAVRDAPPSAELGAAGSLLRLALLAHEVHVVAELAGKLPSPMTTIWTSPVSR